MDAFNEPCRDGAPLPSRVRGPFPRRLAHLLILGVAWVVGWLVSPLQAAELLEGPTVEAQARSATISWRTDVATGARVRYGTAPDRMTSRAEGPVSGRHAITLEGLQPGTRYVFSIGTAKHVLATNAFTTTGGNVATPEPKGATNPVAVPDRSVTGAGAGAGGRTASPAARPQAPPTRETWGSLRTLVDHFERHGRDFGSRNADDYAAQAWEFRQRAIREGLPAKRDTEGVLRIYDPRTRAFGAYNRDGTTRTYFKPGRRDYFDDQPGRPVDLKQESR